MEYRKSTNFLDNALNQPSKFRTKIWGEIVKLNWKIKSSLCDNSDAYLLLKGTITAAGAGGTTTVRQTDRNNKQGISKNYVLFTECITQINNTKADNAKYLDVIMSMYNL